MFFPPLAVTAANSLPEMTGAERASKADATRVTKSQADATWVILFGTDKEYDAHVSDIKQLIPGLALQLIPGFDIKKYLAIQATNFWTVTWGPQVLG